MWTRPAFPQCFRAALYNQGPCKKKQENFPHSLVSAPGAKLSRRLAPSSLAAFRSSLAAMPSAPAVMPESPSLSPTTRQFVRPRSPLANGSAAGDFELRHWRTPKKQAPRWAPPPVIEIPYSPRSDDGSGSSGSGGGGGHGYTSLRDILSSPEYAAAAGTPAANGGVGGGHSSCGDIHMIRHPLVKHAAYTYLQMTPSAREDPSRRGRRWRGPICRLLIGCLSFIGALFRP